MMSLRPAPARLGSYDNRRCHEHLGSGRHAGSWTALGGSRNGSCSGGSLASPITAQSASLTSWHTGCPFGVYGDRREQTVACAATAPDKAPAAARQPAASFSPSSSTELNEPSPSPPAPSSASPFPSSSFSASPSSVSSVSPPSASPPSPPASTSTAAAATTTTEVAAELSQDSITLSLNANELLQSLLLQLFPEGKGQAVVVVGVLEGSQADKAGVVPGQKLLSISDPIRPGDMWGLGERPSLRFVRDILRAMRSKDVALELSSKAVFTSPPASEPGAAASPDVGRRQLTDVDRRISKRKEYMAEVSKRNDNGVLAWAVALFIGPAALILAAAYFSGYLSSMYENSLAAFGR